MAEDNDFKEEFNVWYFLGIVATLLAVPLLHILAGWYVFFFSN